MYKQAFNPYLPSYEYVPDGEPHVFGERIYVYGSHDKFNGNAFCMEDYVCWSAPLCNLEEWRYEGVIYRKTDDLHIPNPQTRRLFAPDVQQGIDGRFYLYYSFDFSGMIGVAVCDKPAGKYTYYGYVHYKDGTILGEREDDKFHYDPGVLADNGEIYLYTGFCPPQEKRNKFDLPKPVAEGAMVTELETDMITIKKKPSIVVPNFANATGTFFEGHAFFEGPSIRKIDNTYYLIYSSEHGHELCYATSDKANEAFVYGGTIVSNGDIYYKGRKKPLNYTGTNHGSIEKIDNQWYVFYHRQTNGNPYSRQGCAEKIEVMSDGAIKQVEMTSCGLNKGALLGKGRYSAGIACCLFGKKGAKAYEVKKQISKEHPYLTQEDGEDKEGPKQYIANMCDGAVAGFKYFNIEKLSTISMKMRGNGNGEIQILTDISQSPVASIQTVEVDEWITISAEVEVKLKGEVALWFCYTGTGYVDFSEFVLK